jgi:3-methyladenine DNA glycosylase/8-oxoguanine DNA glycosylase
MIEITAKPPFSLYSVISSHGWARLAPIQIVEHPAALTTILRIRRERIVRLQIEGTRNGVTVSCDQNLDSGGWKEIETSVSWMLALNDNFQDFYQLTNNEPRLKHVEDKAQGRLLRSPTLFEDVIKTILTTNTSWAGTIRMNKSLVTQFGDPLPGVEDKFSFPQPGKIALSSEEFLREETRLGYRAPYILELARQVDSGILDLEALKTTEMASKELHKKLTSIKGVGEYAAANLMMLLGHYDYLTIDSWAIKMVSQEFFDGESIGPQDVKAVFEPWGKWKGLAYWLWDWSNV